VNRNGTEQLLAAPPHIYSRPRLSPDGRHIAVTILDRGEQVWIYDPARGTLSRLTFKGMVNLDAVWTPDGRRVTFESSPPGGLLWQLVDGSGKAERLLTNRRYPVVPVSWSPDGKVLAFVEVNPTTGQDIWMLRLGDRGTQPFLRTRFSEGAPAFSPDGRWLAYGSNESGRPEIYVQPCPGPGRKWQISAAGGTEPAWNRNGRELFYRDGNRMMVVDVDISASPSSSAGKPRRVRTR
jgi:eukaryotic-like serine/threonine-protein kinase